MGECAGGGWWLDARGRGMRAARSLKHDIVKRDCVGQERKKIYLGMIINTKCGTEGPYRRGQCVCVCVN